MFSWTQPVGYDFSEVETAINEYKSSITDMHEILMKKEKELAAMKARCDDYIKQITEMQINYESLNVPMMSEEQSIQILDNFKNSGSIVLETNEEDSHSTSDYSYQERQRHHREQNSGYHQNQEVLDDEDLFSDIEIDYDEEESAEMAKNRRVERDVKKKIIEDIDPHYISESSDIII